MKRNLSRFLASLNAPKVDVRAFTKAYLKGAGLPIHALMSEKQAALYRKRSLAAKKGWQRRKHARLWTV